MELIIINFMSLFSLLCLFSASAVAAPAPAAANNSTCPMDFNYALKIPWNYTPCGKTSPINEIKTWCCPNLLSLYRVALSRHLKDTSKFLLPNHPTSVSCVQDFQNKLVYFPLLDDAVSICLDPLKFVISPNTCAGIQSTQDWVSQLGPTTLLNSACRPYLANSDCIKCVSAIEKVQAELYSRDGNTSHATDCRLFTIMYAAGIVNQFGPESDRVGNCLSSANFQVDSPKSKKHTVAVVGAILSTALFILVAASSFYYWRRMKDNNGQGFKWFFKSGDRENLERNQSVCLYDTERQIAEFIKSDQFREDEKNDIDVPFVVLESIRVATNNFSDSNKLGKGGFGSVYKGKFPGGQEIAVKRLSSCSGQGFQEFKNEVLLIAKLQHRNLVRLLGYCVEGEEKMLLYEYMPNKSLDYFIFDRTRRVLLNWEISFDIILGIARGLLYLHHDSRLRIIHRDLKTSNVLLDKEMNPKISDFGLARIVEGKRTEASTTRVVGTYGYMPPEYALQGFFSIKSDVFSFGVMILEIISGKRNTGFYQPETEMSLLGYAWKLWKENKPLDLMDATLSKTCNANEFLRCLNIGLLCVQEDPSERPTMSTVVFLLESETVNLPIPKPPAFVAWRFLSSSGSSSQPLSVNELSNTLQQGR